MSKALPEFLGDMRRQRRQQQHELQCQLPRQRFPLARGVGEFHQRRDGGIEPQPLDILGDLCDGPVQRAQLCRRGFAIDDGLFQAAAVA